MCILTLYYYILKVYKFEFLQRIEVKKKKKECCHNIHFKQTMKTINLDTNHSIFLYLFQIHQTTLFQDCKKDKLVSCL